jgi:uncharacterized protein YigA (DUF484 family)
MNASNDAAASAGEVAEYLKKNPKFFEDYADIIAEIFVPHPHGGHAIPIAERQILTLRDKNNELEARFRELVAYGTENDQIGEKLHRSTLALFAAPDLETTLAVLYHSLKEDFAVPQVAARLWGKVPEQSYLPELAATSTEIREYADQLGHPYCGPAAAYESREWFEDGDALQSFAFMPLRTAQTFGLLALGSPDAQRFHAGMGTLYQTRPRGIGECRHRALPAAVLAVRRHDAKPVTKRTVVAPPPKSDTARNAALLDAFAAHLATRPAHTRDAYLGDLRQLAAHAGDTPLPALTRAQLARALATLHGRGPVGPQPGAVAVGMARISSVPQ